jgi:hypothetical protein
MKRHAFFVSADALTPIAEVGMVMTAGTPPSDRLGSREGSSTISTRTFLSMIEHTFRSHGGIAWTSPDSHQLQS